MAFTKIKNTQVRFLEQYLRGTGKQLSSAQASALFSIKNLRARMSDFRAAGLRVRTKTNSTGKVSYSVSRRDQLGSQYKMF